jgi:outer membrane lipoprotein-sorting protein
MKSADEMRQFFKDAGLDVHPDADEKVFEDVLGARQKTPENAPARPDNVWRITMRNPIAKLAVAAIVAVACVTGIILWTGTGSSVALAEVLARIEQVGAYMYQMSMTVTGEIVPGRPTDHEMTGTALLSQEYGVKMSMETADPNGRNILQEIYMLPQKKSMIMLMPGQRKYTQVEFNDAMLERMQKQNNDPRIMVKQILECEYESLGKSSIDGIEVEGFQTTDPRYQAGAFGKVDIKLWVALDTWLPVRCEMDMWVGDSMHIQGVIFDFEWDVPVDAADFEPVIPDDYTTLTGGPIKMPAMNEETAIKGLKLFADLSGKYPEKLGMMDLMAEMGKLQSAQTPAGEQLREEFKGLDVDDIARKTLDTMMPVQMLGAFYSLLVQDKKEPAYYGDTVTPDDADQVLMRWKVSESEYRVVFGDLHAETLTPEALAALKLGLQQ